jgi:hypothetical protein
LYVSFLFSFVLFPFLILLFPFFNVFLCSRSIHVMFYVFFNVHVLYM